MKKSMVLMVLAIVLSLSGVVNAKKINLMNFDKGNIFNDCGEGAIVSLTEEHAEKDKAMLKITIPKGDSSQFWWVGEMPPKKPLWDGYDVIRFSAFNPRKTPISIGLSVKFQYDQTYQKRFNQSIMLKPGKSDVEVEIVGATNVGGEAIDWKKPIAVWVFDGPVSATEDIEFYIGSVTLETAEDADKDEKQDTKKETKGK